MRKKGPPRVLGPYPERNRYRLVVIEDGARKSLYVDSLEAATITKDELERQLERPPTRRLDEALDEYAYNRVNTGRCLERTSIEQMARLRVFLGPYVDQDIAVLTPRAAANLYLKATERTSEKTGAVVSAATQRFYLGLAKSFFNWAVKQGYVKESPFKGVQPTGKVRTGKPQLRIDEARRFAETALGLYNENNDMMALAALMALLLGLRASEVLLRTARDVDDHGRVLWIDAGKTHNAKRHLRVPEVLQPHLLKMIEGLQPEDPLFGRGRTGQPHRRQTLHTAVARVCAKAGVPRVCPHSLRGLYATLAIESGAVADAVAASLGHGSFAMTERHYAQPNSVRNAQTARVLDMLDASHGAEHGGRAGHGHGVLHGTADAPASSNNGTTQPPAQQRAQELLATLDPQVLSQLLALAEQVSAARVKN